MALVPYPSLNFDPTQRVFGGVVVVVPDGDHTIVPAQGMANLTVIADTGCTATIRRVDDQTGAATGDAWDDVGTVTTASLDTTPVDWPWYRIEAAGGSCRVALV